MANPRIMDATGGRPASQGGQGHRPEHESGARPGEAGHADHEGITREIAEVTRNIAAAERELAEKRARLARLHGRLAAR